MRGGDLRRRGRTVGRRGAAMALAVGSALVLLACSPGPEVTVVEADDPDVDATDAADPVDPESDVDAADPEPDPEPGTNPDDPDDGPSGGTVDWAPCDGGSALGIPLECGAIDVPLDYADPGGPTIEIALARVPAPTRDPIGSLVFNPGGPGGSGVDFLAGVAAVIPPELAQRFDLVSFDPRGVGASASVDCAVDLDDDIALLEAGDDEGWAALVDEARAQPETCTEATAALAPHVGTNNAARDLDEIREALGDDQLSYVGFSYGTRLGATYAELFPDRVRALVLDGAVEPTTDATEIDIGQAPAFDRAFEAFAAACDADPDCALRVDGATVDVYDELRREIAAVGTLATADDGRVLTPGELQLGVIAALYSTQLWPLLAEGLHDAAADQDGTVLQALADSYTGRQPDGTYDNRHVAGLAINCADDATRPPEEIVRQQAEAVAEQSAWFDDSLRADTGCIGTPDPVDPIVIGPAVGAAPILVIGNTGDPATPYQWAVDLADFLDSGVLYTVESEGHTAFLSVQCVSPVVVRYLVDLELPSAGGSCADPPGGDVFVPAGEGEFDQIISMFDCLRDNGLDVPDIDIGDILTDPSGEELFAQLDPTDPAFGEALRSCQDELFGS